MRDTEREAQTQAEEEAGSVQGAPRGTRSGVSRITPWAEGGAKPLSHPGCPDTHFHTTLKWTLSGEGADILQSECLFTTTRCCVFNSER